MRGPMAASACRPPQPPRERAGRDGTLHLHRQVRQGLEPRPRRQAGRRVVKRAGPAGPAPVRVSRCRRRAADHLLRGRERLSPGGRGRAGQRQGVPNLGRRAYLCTLALSLAPPADNERHRRRQQASAVRAVAQRLGNTPAVCRAPPLCIRRFCPPTRLDCCSAAAVGCGTAPTSRPVSPPPSAPCSPSSPVRRRRFGGQPAGPRQRIRVQALRERGLRTFRSAPCVDARSPGSTAWTRARPAARKNRHP